MARIQALTLPSNYVGEVVQGRFILVIDQVAEDEVDTILNSVCNMKEETGAEAVLVFDGTMDVAP